MAGSDAEARAAGTAGAAGTGAGEEDPHTIDLADRDAQISTLQHQAGSLSLADKAQGSASLKPQQSVKQLHRQIANLNDEGEGLSKHLAICKQHLQTTLASLESAALLKLYGASTDDEVYALCRSGRRFLGDEEDPPQLYRCCDRLRHRGDGVAAIRLHLAGPAPAHAAAHPGRDPHR